MLILNHIGAVQVRTRRSFVPLGSPSIIIPLHDQEAALISLPLYDRLQSRVSWLIVLAACLALMQTAWCRRLLEKSDFRGA